MKTPSVVINTDTRELKRNGNQVKLPRKEYLILETLAKAGGVVLSREQILDSVWGDAGCEIHERTVDQHVARFRRKVPGVIITSVGMGFRAVGVKIENQKDTYGTVTALRRTFGKEPAASFLVTVRGSVVPTLTDGQKIKVA